MNIAGFFFFSLGSSDEDMDEETRERRDKE